MLSLIKSVLKSIELYLSLKNIWGIVKIFSVNNYPEKINHFKRTSIFIFIIRLNIGFLRTFEQKDSILNELLKTYNSQRNLHVFLRN